MNTNNRHPFCSPTFDYIYIYLLMNTNNRCSLIPPTFLNELMQTIYAKTAIVSSPFFKSCSSIYVDGAHDDWDWDWDDESCRFVALMHLLFHCVGMCTKFYSTKQDNQCINYSIIVFHLKVIAGGIDAPVRWNSWQSHYDSLWLYCDPAQFQNHSLGWDIVKRPVLFFCIRRGYCIVNCEVSKGEVSI